MLAKVRACIGSQQYNKIKKESTLHLVLRFRGGMQSFVKTLTGKTTTSMSKPAIAFVKTRGGSGDSNRAELGIAGGAGFGDD